MSSERDRFEKVLRSNFSLKGADGATTDLELAEVSALRERPHQTSFSLVFLTQPSVTAEQGLYDLHHETLGEVQVFLVPIGIVDERMKLEAVFNSLRED